MSQPFEATSTQLVVPSKRPAALTAAIAASVLAGIGNVASGAGILTGGEQAIREYVRETVGSSFDGDVLEKVISNELDRAFSVLLSKAYAGFGTALFVLLIGLLTLRSARPRRAIFVLLLVGNIVSALMQLGEHDVLPQASLMGSAVAVLASFVGVVLLFMPAVGRYGRPARELANAPRVMG